MIKEIEQYSNRNLKSKQTVVSQRRMKSCQMDETQGYQVKWNKSDKERQTLYDLSYM